MKNCEIYYYDEIYYYGMEFILYFSLLVVTNLCFLQKLYIFCLSNTLTTLEIILILLTKFL